MLIDESQPKVSIIKLSPSSTQEPPSSSKWHLTLILQKNRNTTLNIKSQATQSHTKSIDTPKLTTGHCIALQTDKIQLHPLEHRQMFPQQGNLHKLLVQPHPQAADSTNKRKYDPPACIKDTPNTAN